MSYLRLVRFLLPLAVTGIVIELGSQVLNGGMARVPQATETLAAYGLAWGLLLFLASPLGQSKELGLVLVNNQASLAKVRRFVLIFAIILASGILTLGLSPVGRWVIEDLHGIDPVLGDVVRTALILLVPFPILRGMSHFHAGMLLRVRRTEIVSLATLSNLGISVAMVFVLLPLPFVQSRPILLPVIVTYAGLLVELAIIIGGARRFVRPATLAGRDDIPTPRAAPSYRYIIRFFWPLALIMIIQEFSRPLINLFVSHDPNATAALAILAVLYTLGRIPYGWLNDIRNLAPAFREEENSMAYIRRFTVACGFVSFGIMLLLFWTPLRDYILQTLIGVPADLAALARAPLYIFSFFSFAVTMRAYYHGVGLVERRTRAMAPSAPARLVAIFIALVVLPYFGITGATRGVAALLCGFYAEAVIVWWGVRGRQLLLERRRAAGYA